MFGTDYKEACKWTESSEGYDYNNITRLNGNNNITRLNAYSKYYVPRRPRVGELGRSAGPGDGGLGGSHAGGGSSGRC